MNNFVIANGKQVAATTPCTIEAFLLSQRLSPKAVVVEHNGQAVPPSSFAQRQVLPGDRLEVIKVVAGG